ncbi:MAG: hypothetical protein Q7R90_03355 [bacterium]|nr:hypothetical protein [bacterium]
MPESTIKFYPVIARVLLLLGGLPLVTFRAAIVAVRAEELASYRMVHRFVMEYKGPSDSCSDNKECVNGYRDKAKQYLEKKMAKARRFEGKTLEPMVEVEIDLRRVKPTLAKVRKT